LAIRGSRDDDYCSSTEWRNYLDECLDCAIEFDIWQHYGRLGEIAKACGIDATPKPVNSDDPSSSTPVPEPTTIRGITSDAPQSTTIKDFSSSATQQVTTGDFSSDVVTSTTTAFVVTSSSVASELSDVVDSTLGNDAASTTSPPSDIVSVFPYYI
jgi:hypothetical protein